MSSENIDELDEIINNGEKFVTDTIREYKDEIEKYSLEIDRGNDTTSNYAHLFLNYRGLYLFTRNTRESRCVNKEMVDSICERFLVKVQEELAANINMSENYCHLATIYSYKGDNNAALEFYNKAVELDGSSILLRGEFKNSVLNDKNGALEDFNRALELTDNEEEKESIEFLIKHIDLLRDTRASHKSFNLIMAFIYLVIAGFAAYLCYNIYILVESIINIFH